MKRVLIALCLALSATAAHADVSAEYLLEENAKLAGRARACGDRAVYAGLKSVSADLARYLADDGDWKAYMADFNERADMQQRFASRAKRDGDACRRITEQAHDNMDRSTRVIQQR